MKRLGNISQAVETLQNFREAFFDFSRHKKSRLSVKAFEAELEANLQALLNAYVGDHVIQHAAMHTSEDKLRAKIPFNSPAGTKGRGTHFFYKIIKQDIYTSPQKETFYCLPMDIHHYFQNVEHNLLKREYRLYIKDRKLLAFIDEVVDSYANGIVLGVKLTQLLGQLFLARFDYLAMRCFDILQDPEKHGYWQARYVTDMLLTCRSEQQAIVLNVGGGKIPQ